jgi:hypothetical protein
MVDWDGLIKDVRIIREEAEYRLELKGELAGILALVQGAKNPETAPAQRALQIKMVTGVSFGVAITDDVELDVAC